MGQKSPVFLHRVARASPLAKLSHCAGGSYSKPMQAVGAVDGTAVASTAAWQETQI
jgi:hypothetical protein